MKYLQSYYTDKGSKRETNQDSIALVKAETDLGEVLLAIVCDGMGGYSLGEYASKYCVRTFCRWFKSIFPTLIYDTEVGLETVLQDEWFSLIRRMNSTLANYCERENTKIGSTLNAFLFIGDKYYAVNVGDCRGYRIAGDVVQITKDHSVVAERERKGIENAEKVKRSVLTQSIGITRTVKPDFYTGSVRENECFLLCSDGLWHRTSNDDLHRYLLGDSMRDNQQLRMHLNFLVDQAMNRGEKDNISCLAVIPRKEL